MSSETKLHATVILAPPVDTQVAGMPMWQVAGITRGNLPEKIVEIMDAAYLSGIFDLDGSVMIQFVNDTTQKDN